MRTTKSAAAAEQEQKTMQTAVHNNWAEPQNYMLNSVELRNVSIRVSIRDSWIGRHGSHFFALAHHLLCTAFQCLITTVHGFKS